MKSEEIVESLVGNHRAFLSFLQGKVGSRALAEDILQDAFVRSIDKASTIRDGESATSWFYRVLRNAIIDHGRRNASANRRLQELARELETADHEPETMNQVCQCVSLLAGTLKPEYAEAVRRIEVEGMSVKEFAALSGITASNAGVRIFRAREALRQQVVRSCGTCADHGCLDCTCVKKSASGTGCGH